MVQEDSAVWTMVFTGKTKIQKNQLPPAIAAALDLLTGELAIGPERPKWPNYGKIAGKKNVYHCHLNKGKPRYVAIWKVTNRQIKLMEVRYVGTHENADYRNVN